MQVTASPIVLKLLSACFAALTLACPALAANFEEQVDRLTGYWATAEPVRGAPVVLLRISNVLFADKGAARVVAYFGDTRKGTAEAKQAGAVSVAGRLTLQLALAGDAQAELTANADMTALEGRYTAPGQKPAELRLARRSLADIHAWMARNPDTEAMKAGAGSVIELVYISARDCYWCRVWESEYLYGPAKLAKSGLWPDIRFTEQKRGLLRSRESPENFPEHLKAAMRELVKTSRRLMSTSPSYVLFVNGTPRVWGSGTNDYATLIHPALEAAVEEKRSATAAPAQAARPL